MIILAAAVIITLNNNSNIITRTQEAVESQNLKQVQELAQTAWLDAYVGGERDVDELKAAVDAALEANKIDTTKYEISVTDKEVTVELKETTNAPSTTPDDEIPEQLSKPTISVEGTTLTITDNTANGSNTERFDVYVVTEKKGTITASATVTFD